MTTKRMVIIESDRAFANQVRSMFSRYDVEITIFEDGKEGQDAVMENPPDIIILCVELPKMSGYTICTKLKKEKKTKNVPLIIMSSEATEETFAQHRRLKNHAEDYIIKPFTEDQIVPKVTALVPLEQLESPPEEEIIALDDDDVLIEDLSNFDDEALKVQDNGAEGATVVGDRPTLGDEDKDLENFEEVLDSLEEEKVPEPEPQPQAAEAEKEKEEDLENFDDLLKLDEEESPPEVTHKESVEQTVEKEQNKTEAKEEDLELSGLENLDSEALLDDELKVEFNEPPAKAESVAEDDLDLHLQGLEPVEEPALSPKIDTPAAAAPVAEAVTPPKVETKAQPSGPTPVEAKSEPAVPSQPVTEKPAADPLLLTKLKNAESECNLLREKVASLEQKLEEAHSDYEKRLNDLSQGKKDTSREKEILALRSELNTRDREILNLKEEITRKDQEILDAREKIGERDEEINRLQESIAKRDREIKDISSRLEEMLRAKNELQERHEAKMAEWEERYTNETAKLEHEILVQKEETQRLSREADQRVAKVQAELDSLRNTFEDTKQRHNDEIYGLRTRYKNEFDRLEGEKKQLQKELDEVRAQLAAEKEQHNKTRQQAAEVPGLKADLEQARNTIQERDNDIKRLKEENARSEERLVKAYQKIKSDEKIKEKARKALEIGLTLLAEQPEGENRPAEQSLGEKNASRV